MKKHNKRYIRILSALLSIITLICMLPVSAIAIDTSLKNAPEYASDLNEFDTINGAYTDEEDLVDSFQEDTSMRSEYAKHYVNSSGKRYMVIFPEQVHYLEDDTWKEVNNTLTLDSYKKEYISSNPKFITRFSKEANSSKLVTIEDGNYSLSWTIFFESNKKETMSSTAIASDSATSLQPNATSVSARVAELNEAVTDSVKTKETITQLGKALSNISYSGVFNRSVDLRYSVLHGKVEEDVILNTPDSLSSYTLIIDTHGLMASKLADNTVVFLTSEGKEIFRLAAPWMKDSGIAVSDAIDVSVVQKENTAFITYTPNQEWLQDSSRVYPVLIDPSFTTRFYTSNYEDTYVYSGDSASTTRPTETTMKVGNISGSTYYAYCKIKNIPEFVGGTGYPDNVTFTIWANTTSSPALSLYQVTGNWSPSSITYANQPGASLITSGITGIVNGSNSKYSFDLTSWLQYSLRDDYGDPLYYNVWDFFKSSDWHGFKLGYTTNLTGNYTQIYSSEHSTASYRPVMTVEYTYWPYGGIENDAVFSFINSASGKYLTVDNGNTDNGTNVYQYTKNNTLSQAFRLYYEESDNCFRIRAMCSSDGRGSVLEVPSFGGTIDSSGYTNSNVRLYGYGASFRDDQQWIIYPHNSSSGLYKIVLRADPGLALTAYGTENGTASGTTSTSAGNVFVSQFTGAANQLWKIESGGIQLFPTIDIRKETGKSMEYYENRNWYSFCCPVTNFGDTVTWSSSNPQSLIVDSVGRVSSLTAGESVLRATVRHADGTYDYYTVTFYVTIPDGTYYLNDKANNYRLEYEKFSDLSENAVLESYNSGTYEPTNTGRFFKIKYLGDGLYSIRSMLDCSMGWTRSNTSLVMTTIGPLDKNIPDTAKWRIKSNANGYYIHSKYGTSRTVTAGSSSGGNISLQSYSSTNTRQNWEIKKITKSYHGVILKKTVSKIAVGNSTQFMAGVYSTYTDVNGQKGITWSVTNGTGSASINSTTGVLTGIAQGTITVKATFKPNSSQTYEATCTLTVISIQEGTYFIQNKHYGKYIQVDNDDAPTYNKNGGVIEQWTLDREDYQKWKFSYVSDGYYKIQSFISGYAITVPAGKETNSDVSLILKPYDGSANQLWKITKTSAGNYKIKAKSSSSYTSKDLVMRVNTKGLHSENGLNIMQMPYTNDTDYVDEWILQGAETLFMLGIEAGTGHDHQSCFTQIMDLMEDTPCSNFNYIYSDSITKAAVGKHMEDCQIYVSRSHGNYDNEGTYILLADDGSQWIHSSDLFNYTTNKTSINLGDCELMLFVACLTGNHSRSLPNAAVDAGAKYAVGFIDSIGCSTATQWTTYFFQYYHQNFSVAESCQLAMIACGGNINGIGSYKVCS